MASVHSYKLFTSYMKRFIRTHYRYESKQMMADKLHTTKSCVAKFMKVERLVPTAEEKFCIYSNAQSSSTLVEDRFIEKHYLAMPIKTMGRTLGRSEVFVRTRLSVLGLVIPREITEQRIRDFRIKPGNVPANKGKKMTRQQYRKAKPTFFKPGHTPANTLYNGAITIRNDNRGVPQKYIRIRKMKWDYLSRYNWRKHHGRIPRSMVIAFKDGDTLNCDISNLMMISKADNMRRNTRHNYPPEVQEVIILNNKLKKAINAKKQN